MPDSNAEAKKEYKKEDLPKFFESRSENIEKVFSNNVIKVGRISSRSIEKTRKKKGTQNKKYIQEFSFELTLLTTADKGEFDTFRIKSLIDFFKICLHQEKEFVIKVPTSYGHCKSVEEAVSITQPGASITIKLHANVEDINLDNLHQIDSFLDKELELLIAPAESSNVLSLDEETKKVEGSEASPQLIKDSNEDNKEQSKIAPQTEGDGLPLDAETNKIEEPEGPDIKQDCLNKTSGGEKEKTSPHPIQDRNTDKDKEKQSKTKTSQRQIEQNTTNAQVTSVKGLFGYNLAKEIDTKAPVIIAATEAIIPKHRIFSSLVTLYRKTTELLFLKKLKQKALPAYQEKNWIK